MLRVIKAEKLKSERALKKQDLIDSLAQDEKNTALHKLALHNSCPSSKTVEDFCWKQKINLSEKNIKGWSALHTAAALGHEKIVELLVKEANSRYRTYSFSTFSGNNYEIDDLTNSDKKNTLSLSLEYYGTPAVVALLLKGGIKVDFSHLEQVLENFSDLTMLKLLSTKLDLNIYRDSAGNTIWHIAVQKDDPRLISYLAQDEKFKDSLNQYNHAGHNPLTLALATRKKNETVKSLLKAGVALNNPYIVIRSSSVVSRLANLTTAELVSFLDGFYNSKAAKFPSDLNDISDSPLHIAVQTGNLTAIEYLVQTSVERGEAANDYLDLNQMNAAGKTALHLAVDFKYKNIILFLLESNANPNCFSSAFQYTSWDLAEAYEYRSRISSVASSPITMEPDSPVLLIEDSQRENPEITILDLFDDLKKSCAFLEFPELAKISEVDDRHAFALQEAIKYITAKENIRAAYIYDSTSILYYISKYQGVKWLVIAPEQITEIKNYFKSAYTGTVYSEYLKPEDLKFLDGIFGFKAHIMRKRVEIDDYKKLKVKFKEWVYKPLVGIFNGGSNYEVELQRSPVNYYAGWIIFAVPSGYALYKNGPVAGGSVLLMSTANRLGLGPALEWTKAKLLGIEKKKDTHYLSKKAAWLARNSITYIPKIISPITVLSRAIGTGTAFVVKKVNPFPSKNLESLFYVLGSELSLQVYQAGKKEAHRKANNISTVSYAPQLEQTQLIWNSITGRWSEKYIEGAYKIEDYYDVRMARFAKLIYADRLAALEMGMHNFVLDNSIDITRQLDKVTTKTLRVGSLVVSINLAQIFKAVTVGQWSEALEQAFFKLVLNEKNEYRTIRECHILESWALLLAYDAAQAKKKNASNAKEREAAASEAHKNVLEAYDRTPQGITYAAFQMEDTAFFNAKIESSEQLEKLKAKRETAKAAHAAKLTTNGEAAFRSACTRSETSFYIYWSQTTSNEIKYRKNRIETLKLQRQDVRDRLSRVEKLPELHGKLYMGHFSNQFLVDGASKETICSGAVGYLIAIGYIQTDAQADIIYNDLMDSDFMQENAVLRRHNFSGYVGKAVDKCKGWEAENKESLQQQELDLNSAIQDNETAINALTPLSKEFGTEANTLLNAVKVENPEGSSFIVATEQNIQDFDNTTTENSRIHNEDMEQSEKTLQQRNDNYDALVPFLKQQVFLQRPGSSVNISLARKLGPTPAKQESSVHGADYLTICITGDNSGPLGYFGPYDPHGCDAYSENTVPSNTSGSGISVLATNTGSTNTTGMGGASSTGSNISLGSLTANYSPLSSGASLAGQGTNLGTGPAVDTGASQASMTGAITSSLPPTQSFADAKPLEVPVAVPFAGVGAIEKVQNLEPYSLNQSVITFSRSSAPSNTSGSAKNNESVNKMIQLKAASLDTNTDIRVATTNVSQTLFVLALEQDPNSNALWQAFDTVDTVLDSPASGVAESLIGGFRERVTERVGEAGDFIKEEVSRFRSGEKTKTAAAIAGVAAFFTEERNKMLALEETHFESTIRKVVSFIGSEIGYLEKDEQTQIGQAFAKGLLKLEEMPKEVIAYNIGTMLADSCMTLAVGRAVQGASFVGKSFNNYLPTTTRAPLLLSTESKALGLVSKGGLPKVSYSNLSRVNNNRIDLSSPITFYRKALTSEALNELAKPIDHALVKSMEKKGWTVVVAKEGSEHFRYLSIIGADASINTAVPKHILIKETAPKSALLEEYLHGSQLKLGLLEKYGSTQALEVHVKVFMLRHVKMLGLDNLHDIKLLQQLKIEELNRLRGAI